MNWFFLWKERPLQILFSLKEAKRCHGANCKEIMTLQTLVIPSGFPTKLHGVLSMHTLNYTCNWYIWDVPTFHNISLY